MANGHLQTLLQVADDFVDQVITSACKLAKLRQSSQLDIRDLQIILERNYNIRVPGYASDELRTVKKIQPTQAWTQKLSAVQVRISTTFLLRGFCATVTTLLIMVMLMLEIADLLLIRLLKSQVERPIFESPCSGRLDENDACIHEEFGKQRDRDTRGAQYRTGGAYMIP